jgi:cell fate regulator YaaT (PSP1 superfamily)
VWARDMMKMSPGADCFPCWADGIIPMHCKTSLPLPSVEMENLVLQHLEWRDIEKLKWRCGKIKCSLIYELDIYIQESKKFPPKWSYVENEWREVSGIVSSFNIMNGDVTIKTKDGVILRIPYTTIKKIKPWSYRPEEWTKNVTPWARKPYKKVIHKKEIKKEIKKEVKKK